MGSGKSVFGVIAALLPVLFIGGFLYYFLDFSGSVENAKTIGLGPTVLGLGGVGFLFCIPLIVKIVRLFGGPRSPGSGRGDGTESLTALGGLDADTVIARYMVSRSAESDPSSPAAPLKQEKGQSARPPSFGRKTR